MMIKLSITIQKPEEKTVVKAEGLSDSHIQEIIQQLTQGSPVKVAYKNVNEPKEKVISALVTTVKNDWIPPANLSFSFSGEGNPFESSHKPNENGPYPNTKVTPTGILLLRTYMKCPHCNREHKNRYSRYSNPWIKCFGCDEKVLLAPISPETFLHEGEMIPVMAADGYYLVANEPYEEVEERELQKAGTL